MKQYAYVGSLGFLAIITTEFGIIGILPQVAAYYEVSIDKAGYLLSAFALVIAITGPFMTLLASRYNRKKVMLVAIFIFCLSGIASFLSPPFWLLLLVRVVPAFLQPVYIATALSVAVSQGNGSNENKLMRIVFSGVAIASVSTIPLATYIASHLSWQYAFIVQTVVSAVALAGIYLGLPSLPASNTLSYRKQLKILKQPTFVASTAVNFFMIAAWFSTYSYFAEYLNKVKGMNSTIVSYLLFLFGVVGIIANWVAGKMLDKCLSTTVAIFLSGTILIPVLLQVTGENIFATTVVVALWGFLYSPSFLNASTYMISSVSGSLSFANSLATSFGNLGVTLGTTAGGWMIVKSGVAFTPWLTLGFGLVAFAMMALRRYLELRAIG